LEVRIVNDLGEVKEAKEVKDVKENRRGAQWREGRGECPAWWLANTTENTIEVHGLSIHLLSIIRMEL